MRRHTAGIVAQDCRPGPSTVLSREEEVRLAAYCITMADMGFGLTREGVMAMAFSIAEKSGRDHPFKSGHAGRGWNDGFMSRHVNLTLRVPQPLSNSVLDELLVLPQAMPSRSKRRKAVNHKVKEVTDLSVLQDMKDKAQAEEEAKRIEEKRLERVRKEKERQVDKEKKKLEREKRAQERKMKKDLKKAESSRPKQEAVKQSTVSGKSGKVQVATLLTVIGEEAREVYSTFTDWTNAGDENKIQPVLEVCGGGGDVMVEKLRRRMEWDLSSRSTYCQPQKNVPFQSTFKQASSRGARDL